MSSSCARTCVRSAPGVDPAERVGAASGGHRPFQDAAAPSRRAVDQPESSSLEAPQDAEPIAEHLLVGPAHLEARPPQVDRGHQVMNALQGPGLDPVLEKAPLGAEQVCVQEVDLKR